jgi:hypothetical protein
MRSKRHARSTIVISGPLLALLTPWKVQAYHTEANRHGPRSAVKNTILVG